MSAATDMGRSAMRTALRAGGSRAATLESRRLPRQVTIAALPAVLGRMFDPAAAHGLSDVLELRVREPGGGSETKLGLRIADGRCRVVRGGAPDARAYVAVGVDDMVLLASGCVPWPTLLASKRLELGGDPFLALRFPKLFRLPA